MTVGEEENSEEESPKKVIIFELDDVLFKPDEDGCVADNDELSVFMSLAALWPGISRSVTHYFSTMLLRVLRENHEYDHLIAGSDVRYRGRSLPSLWCAYYLNELTAEQALEKAKLTIEAHGSWGCISILKFAVAVGFSPEQEAQYLKPIEPGIKIAQDCLANKNNRVLLFSNKSPETMRELVRKNPDFFELFRPSNIVISGNHKKLKPNEGAFQKLIGDYGLEIKDCYFIDSQQLYLDVPCALGAKTFKIRRKHNEEDYSSLRDYFIAEGVIASDKPTEE